MNLWLIGKALAQRNREYISKFMPQYIDNKKQESVLDVLWPIDEKDGLGELFQCFEFKIRAVLNPLQVYVWHKVSRETLLI